MSKLGELIDYTGEECPNCGRVRVELWSCGKRICEKCHWCIEDQAYYYEDWDDEEEEPINYFGLKNVIDTEESGTLAKVCISGSGRTFSETMVEIVRIREENRKRLDAELDSYRERAESLGVDIDDAQMHADAMGIPIGGYLDMIESFIKTKDFDGDSLFKSEIPDEQPEWTDAQIRKQLKYEKNPMRVKELNKMLSGRKKKRK